MLGAPFSGRGYGSWECIRRIPVAGDLRRARKVPEVQGSDAPGCFWGHVHDAASDVRSWFLQAAMVVPVSFLYGPVSISCSTFFSI